MGLVTGMTQLSVLDLVPVRTDQTTADALAASRQLAQSADGLGFTRYWVAEHHNMPAVAATNPPVLIGFLAAATERIRVGSGGVMLPNHTPLVVAEQFAMLEAAFPGRIDLGIGRAPGSDPLTSRLLRRTSAHEDAVARFPRDVQDILALLDPDGVRMTIGDRPYELRATPRASAAPPVWLLGSSLYSAELAGELGLPYVFAYHFAGRGVQEALARYRSGFRPARAGDEPRTIAVVNTVVAPDAATARRLAEPQLRTMLRLRTGQPLTAQPSVEEAEAETLTVEHTGLLEAMAESWVIDAPGPAAARLTELAASMRTDEVMVVPVAGAPRSTPAAEAPGRVATLELLAEQML